MLKKPAPVHAERGFVKMTRLPILYSFRRCPYAIRARMALLNARVRFELREVLLRDRPDHMMQISPKGTVPVLLLPEGEVLEESMDIMLWCSPESWVVGDWAELVEVNDGDFKENLDRYKYSDHYEDALAPEVHRAKVLDILQQYEVRLGSSSHFCGGEMSLADVALAPFVRQFANTDREWFDAQELPNVQRWLNLIIEGDLFKRSMVRQKRWRPPHSD